MSAMRSDDQRWCLGCGAWVSPEMRRIAFGPQGGDGREAPATKWHQFCPRDAGEPGHVLVLDAPSDSPDAV